MTVSKKIIIGFFLLELLAFFALNSRHLMRVEGDGVFYYSWLRSMAIDYDFDFKNELEHFSAYDRGSQAILADGKVTGLGKIINPYAYGTALLWSPFFLSAHVISHLFNLPTDGFADLYIWTINFATWLYGCLALLLIYASLRKFFDAKFSLISVLGIYLATPFIYYQFFEPSMSHIASVFMVALFFYLVLNIYENKKTNPLSFSLVVFLMVAVRWQNLLFGVILLPLLYVKRRDLKLVIRTIISAVIPVVVFWTTQMLIWHNLYGKYFLLPQGRGFVRPEFHGLYILFSSNRGLLLWSPILILAVIGFYYLWRKSKFIFAISLLAFLAQWLINGSLNDLGGGDAFGARRFIETLPFLAFPLVAFWEKFKYQKTAWLITLLFIIVNLILIQNYRLGIIPHYGEFNFLQIDYLKVFFVK